MEPSLRPHKRLLYGAQPFGLPSCSDQWFVLMFSPLLQVPHHLWVACFSLSCPKSETVEGLCWRCNCGALDRDTLARVWRTTILWRLRAEKFAIIFPWGFFFPPHSIFTFHPKYYPFQVILSDTMKCPGSRLQSVFICNRRIDKRSKYSRRRAYNDDADIDYINERNAKFNKKAERFYGKYAGEIKQNLERGTAV